jgi:predicted transport protein
MEFGRVKVDQQKKQYDFQIKRAKIFATANEINRLSKTLQSRFRRLFLPKYTEQQFIDVSVKVLKDKNRDSLARYVGKSVWDQKGDVRDVLSIGKLVRKLDGPGQIELIIKTMIKYGVDGE